MARSNLQRKIIVADTEEELEDKTILAQRPGQPDPDDPGEQPPPEPVTPPVPDEDPEKVENGDDDEDDEEIPADPPHTATTPSQIHYESRITIVDAWQYPGNVRHAPDWIDRNWIGYISDYDDERKIEPGPCLRVPLPSGVTAIVRIGDFVATQQVRLTASLVDTRIEVWHKDQFERLFIPSRIQ